MKIKKDIYKYRAYVAQEWPSNSDTSSYSIPESSSSSSSEELAFSHVIITTPDNANPSSEETTDLVNENYRQ
jgi:hypothetical protein